MSAMKKTFVFSFAFVMGCVGGNGLQRSHLHCDSSVLGLGATSTLLLVAGFSVTWPCLPWESKLVSKASELYQARRQKMSLLLMSKLRWQKDVKLFRFHLFWRKEEWDGFSLHSHVHRSFPCRITKQWKQLVVWKIPYSQQPDRPAWFKPLILDLWLNSERKV